jgi:MFS family permease
MKSPPILTLYLRKTAQFSRNAKLVLIYSAITGLAFGVFRFLFNFYVLSLGPEYDEAFVGTLQTASSFASIAMALPAVYIADRYSHKGIMVTTGWLSGFFFLGLVLLPSKLPLILFSMAAGMAMSARQVAMAPFLMANTADEERQWVFSFNFGVMTVAGFMGNLLGGMMPTWFSSLAGVAPTDTLAYQLTLGSMMLVTILSIGPLRFIQPTALDPERKVEMPWTQLRRHGRRLSYFLLPQLIIGLGAGLMMPFMNIYFRNVYERPDPTIAIIFAISGLGMAVAQFVGPPMADKWGKIGAVIMTQIVSVPFLILLGLGAWFTVNQPQTAGFWFIVASVAFIIRLSLMNLSNPIYQTFILERVPRDAQALAMSLSSIAFQFGWFVMPQISGWLQVRFGPVGFAYIFGMVAGLYVTAFTIEWFFFVRNDRLSAAPALSSGQA